MSKNKTEKISIREYVRDHMKQSVEFAQRSIDKGLAIDNTGNRCFVHSVGMATILTTEKIPGIDLNDKTKKVSVNGMDYINDFCKGFLDGQAFFKTTFIDSRLQDPDTLVSDLQSHYYEYENNNEVRWRDYVNGTPLVISDKIIQDWGYHNGIVDSLKKLIKQYPGRFKNFFMYEKWADGPMADLISLKRLATSSQAYLQANQRDDNSSELKEPKDKKELFEQFYKYHCQGELEGYQRNFNAKYGKANGKILRDEIKPIIEFIESANQLSTAETFKDVDKDDKSEYSRFINGFYARKVFEKGSVYDFFNVNTIKVVSRCKFYKEWLSGQLLLDEVIMGDIQSGRTLTPHQKEKIKRELKGDNKSHFTSPVFHHIKKVLEKYSLTSSDAREILLDMQGSTGPKENTNVFRPIIGYLEEVDFKEEKKHEKSNGDEPQLSLRQIALKHCYEGVHITEENKNDIAEENGHKSGDKLKLHYNYYIYPANRTGREPTELRLKNKINLINSVIELLPQAKKARAIEELNTLKSTLENGYQ